MPYVSYIISQPSVEQTTITVHILTFQHFNIPTVDRPSAEYASVEPPEYATVQHPQYATVNSYATVNHVEQVITFPPACAT